MEKKKKDKSVFHSTKKKSEKVLPEVQFQYKASMKPTLDSSTDSKIFFQNESASRFVLMASSLLGLGLPPGQQFSSV